MILVLSEALETELKNWKTKALYKKYLPYPEIVGVVSFVIKRGYEISHIKEDEFTHQITLLKHQPKKNYFFLISINGTKEEIDNLLAIYSRHA